MFENFEIETEHEELEMYCPNCDQMWGIEEMSFQECDSCGYPHEDMYEDESDYEDCEDDSGYEFDNPLELLDC